MLLAVRSSGDPLLLVSAVRNEVAQIDRELPLANVRTMNQIASASRSGARLVLLLTGVFSALALVLAAIGTYGVISYSVAQRVHEFGLRIALGARNRDLLMLVGGQGLRLALIGIALGLLLSLALGRFLKQLVIWRAGARSAYVSDGIRACARSGFDRMLCSGTARNSSRSDDLIAVRVAEF